MKPFSIICISWFLAVFFAGCARQADTANPVRFTEGALVFDYPGNWKVTSNESLGEGRLVTLEEPGNAIMTITAFAPGVEISLKEYGEDLGRNMMGSALGGWMTLKSDGKEQTAERLQMKFTVSIVGVHVPHTMEVTRHTRGGTVVFCMSQVADEDRHLVQAGFDLIRGSIGVGEGTVGTR